jgi:anti-anti-sigma regulatory factor
LREALGAAVDIGQDLFLDLRDVSVVDSAFVGLLLVAGEAWRARNRQLRLSNVSWKLRLYLVTIGMGKEFFTTESTAS